MKCLHILLLFSLFGFSQKEDYSIYHKYINNAEVFFLMENNVDSSIYYYDKAFAEFEFNFLKDLVNSAQIAKFSKKPHIKYIEKGFEFGLKLNHLNRYPILKSEIEKLKKNKTTQTVYKVNRAKYLKKIDFEYLNTTYDLAINDQVNKYLPRQKYNHKLSYDIERIKKIIDVKGFPGEKNLGISDSTIFKEIKHLMYRDISKRLYNKPKARTYKEIEESQLMSSIVIPLFLHYDFCFFNTFDEKDLIKEIKSGNLHPRDIALINDFSYTQMLSGGGHCGSNYKGLYWTDSGFSKKTFDITTANKLREKYFMVPYEVDLMKIEFKKKHKLVFNHGYNYDSR
jgi:hypothetical protein